MGLLRRGKPPPRASFPGYDGVVEISDGSLTAVYRAREIDTNRLVALMVLNVRDVSARELEAFDRESAVLAALGTHRHIVTLYRTFRTVDGRPGVVLELCDVSLADRLADATALPVAEAVSIGVKIAGALDTAHGVGILHHHVSPQNILLTAFGEPVLTGFGLGILAESTHVCSEPFDPATLHAAPELLEGEVGTAATDVYGLASTLHHMIAGRPAFRAYEGESPAAVVLRILRDPVPPLVDAAVPTALRDLLVRAMSKDSVQRPRTVGEFADALSAIEATEGWPRTAFVVRHVGRSELRAAGASALRVAAGATLRRADAPAARTGGSVTVRAGRSGAGYPIAPAASRGAVAAAGRPAEAQYPIPPAASGGGTVMVGGPLGPIRYPIPPAERDAGDVAGPAVPRWASRGVGSDPAEPANQRPDDPFHSRRRQ